MINFFQRLRNSTKHFISGTVKVGDTVLVQAANQYETMTISHVCALFCVVENCTH